MKKLFLLVLLFSGLKNAGAQSGNNVEVIVNGVKDDKGVIMVGLFNTAKTFTEKPWKGEKLKSQSGTVRMVFADVPPGTYAVSVYHDANENGSLDKGFFGIPKEGFGFSKDVMGKFGPPSFDEASFKSPVAEPLSITMKYY